MDKDKLKEKFGQNLKENVPLAQYTTFKIGGPAKYFIETKSSEELINAVKTAEEQKIPYLILAGGSNILVSDQGFNGLVIKIQNSKFKISAKGGSAAGGQKTYYVIAEAGANLNKIINACGKAGLTGLEWLAGIYGTIGGAVYGNAGAYGHSISELVKQVEVYKNGKVYKLKNKDCQFGYRDSIFKQGGGIILSIELKLNKGKKSEIQRVIKEIIAQRGKRISKQPSAGSIFKNVPVSEIDKTRLLKALDISEAEYKSLVKGDKFPTGYIIEALGYSGKVVGGAKISEEHGNVILNLGQAKAADVIMLISMIKQKVRNKLGIQLQEEIQLIGF